MYTVQNTRNGMPFNKMMSRRRHFLAILSFFSHLAVHYTVYLEMLLSGNVYAQCYYSITMYPTMLSCIWQGYSNLCSVAVYLTMLQCIWSCDSVSDNITVYLIILKCIWQCYSAFDKVKVYLTILKFIW